MNKNHSITAELALGGGGAKGVFHIAALEVIDKLDIDVTAVSGSSVGSVAAVLYASGLSGKDLRKLYTEVFEHKINLLDSLSLKQNTRKHRWYNLLSTSFTNKSGILIIDELLDFIVDKAGTDKLEDLFIPVKIVATDFWNRQQVTITQGSIREALRASMALPGIISPLEKDNSILIDGGITNPVPFDVLERKSDLVIAIDILGSKNPEEDITPSIFESLFNTYQIMEETIVREKLKQCPPDVYFKPNIENIRVLEFHKYEEIFKFSEEECLVLENRLLNSIKQIQENKG